MTSQDFIIREITPADNAELANVVRSVILEMGHENLHEGMMWRAMSHLLTQRRIVYFHPTPTTFS